MTTPTADDILDAAAQAASDGVQSASFSAGSTSHSAMSIRDQLELVRFLREEQAQSKNHGGIRFMQIVPPGARNDL